MLILKILKKDFLRQKSITLVVFALIMISAMLFAGGSGLIVQLTGALDSLFESSRAPHFVQMHAGEINKSAIKKWSLATPHVKEQQTVEMISIDGSALFLGSSPVPEENSIMDISFVKQNRSFDFLLDMDNRVLKLNRGEIAVPVYYMKEKNINTGDTVRVKNDSLEMTFTVTDILRDAQMNPSIIHSKRFLVSDTDFASLQQGFHEKEYLIEFLLNNTENIKEFSEAYQASGLPDRGPAVDYNLFKALNGLTDGIAAGVVIILSLLLMIIALLCLRFTLIASIEGDYREIGVMKAIGIAKHEIRKIYLSRYAVLGLLASVTGSAASAVFAGMLSSNILMYMGKAPESTASVIVPAGASGIIFFTVIVTCLIILRRFNRITAVEALRSGAIGEQSGAVKFMSLKSSRVSGVNIFLGLKGLVQGFRGFALLCFIFFFSSAFIIIPLNFLTTIQSPDFVSYMGIGKSHIRIDLKQSDDIDQRFTEMTASIEQDRDVELYSPMVTSRFKMINNEGREETINIETGDFSLFPLDYLEGTAPARDDEIALSYLNSREMDKKPGDHLTLIVNGLEKIVKVSGIYQDVTNGGRTAKAGFPFNSRNALWYTVSLNLKPGVNINDKVHYYSEAFSPARVTDLKGYLGQTLGSTIEQLGKVTAVAAAAGIAVSVLITALFLKMLISGDLRQIAIMKSLGFTLHDIRKQYLTKTLLTLAVGIVLGTFFANTMGESIVSFLWSFMGASQIRFVINPLMAYFIFPLILLVLVSITTLAGIRGIKETKITDLITE